MDIGDRVHFVYVDESHGCPPGSIAQGVGIIRLLRDEDSGRATGAMSILLGSVEIHRPTYSGPQPELNLRPSEVIELAEPE
jgi:hypothetical protein